MPLPTSKRTLRRFLATDTAVCWMIAPNGVQMARTVPIMSGRLYDHLLVVSRVCTAPVLGSECQYILALIRRLYTCNRAIGVSTAEDSGDID